MSWSNFAAMKGQQAPTSRPGVSLRQAVRSAPSQTASTSRNRKVGQASAASRTSESNVRIELKGPSNSRSRSMRIAPILRGGGGRAATIVRRTKPAGAAWSMADLGRIRVEWNGIRSTSFRVAHVLIGKPASTFPGHALTLRQAHARIVPVHQHAGGERQRQIDQHGDADDLD